MCLPYALIANTRNDGYRVLTLTYKYIYIYIYYYILKNKRNRHYVLV